MTFCLKCGLKENDRPGIIGDLPPRQPERWSTGASKAFEDIPMEGWWALIVVLILGFIMIAKAWVVDLPAGRRRQPNDCQQRGECLCTRCSWNDRSQLIQIK